MKDNHPDEKKQVFIHSDDEIAMADLVLESLDQEDKIDLEPFELYSQKLRSHIHADRQLFREKFLKGYEALLEVVKKDE